MEGGHVARYGAANLGPGREKYETHCLLRMAEKRKKELTIVMDCGATLNQSRPACMIQINWYLYHYYLGSQLYAAEHNI